MIRKYIWIVFIAASCRCLSSDYGVNGLIDVPTARMSEDSQLTFTSAIQSRTNSYSLTYQATPWMETTFRYTGFNEFSLWDRNYETKFRLFKETKYLPQVALGIRDMFGTGFWSSEYLVGSKKIGDLDISLGLGWGRLAGDGDFTNPMTKVSDKFKSRSSVVGMGGTLSDASFFSGESVGLFGGLKYKFKNYPLELVAEFNPDIYASEVKLGSYAPKSKMSYAAKYKFNSGLTLSVSRQHAEEWGIELSASTLTQAIPKKRKNFAFFRSSLDYSQDELPFGIEKDKWYETLLFDVERAGILMFEAHVDQTMRKVSIVMGNYQYPMWTDAVSKMLDLANLHLPREVKFIHIVVQENGHRLYSLNFNRDLFFNSNNDALKLSSIGVNPYVSVGAPKHRTNFVTGKIYMDLNISSKFQLFDPEDPARYQIFAKLDVSSSLPRSWMLIGSYSQNLKTNFDEITRQSDSVLPRVRSDIVRYLTESKSGLDSLYLEKRGNYGTDIFFRLYGGVLEMMYSGLGFELLYKPFKSRLGLGYSSNLVIQRDFGRNFAHLDYKTTTSFLSLFWATPYHGYDLALHYGRFLAKDRGLSIELRRTFHNGWMVGAWATKTDVSYADFGEGSFDKGLFFKIPLSKLFGVHRKSNHVIRLRPVQRDGGQRLEDFSGNIWWDLRDARYEVIYDTKQRLL